MHSDKGGVVEAPTFAINRRYLLALLATILACNYIDRLVFGLVLQDLKADLNLTDTQLGFLSGFAFALFYAVMGLPIARWADRGNRVTIVGVTTALWSAATALCGSATSFVQLLLFRVGVAVGEAGCYPSGHSLIGSYFSRSERPRAVARYMLGMPIALIVGNLAAGWLNQLYGWRATFVLIGVPGVVLALLVFATLKDPERARSSPVRKARPARPSETDERVIDALKELMRNRSFRHFLYCFAIWGFFGNGILQWVPAFFVRSFGMKTGELGTWLALVQGVTGLAGGLFGGEIAARLAANNERLQLVGVAAAYVIMAVFFAALYLSPTASLAFAFFAIISFFGPATNGPFFAAIQSAVPSNKRAISVAILYFLSNLIGLGLGPLSVGIISDTLRPWLFEESLRVALLLFSPGYLWCAWHLWRASRSISADIQAASEADQAVQSP